MQERDWTLTFLFLIFVLQFSKHFYMHRLVWSSKKLCQLARHIVILAYLTAETQRLSLIWNPTSAWELTTVFLVSALAWPSPSHTASGKMSFGSSLSDQLVSLHVIRVLVTTVTDEEEGQLVCFSHLQETFLLPKPANRYVAKNQEARTSQLGSTALR